MPIITIDLNFQGIPGTIASYLIPHAHGALLIESGPGSTIPALQAGLRQHGFTEKDVTAVLLTHIHLDHAGAAGWLARQGAQIYVHPVGAPHMINPEKLIASAQRVYGDRTQALWGDFLPVPEERLTIVNDEDVVEIDELRLRALDTPGHANHHHAYIFEGTCFTGDVAGVRIARDQSPGLPMVPPEFIPEKWLESLDRLIREFKDGSFTHLRPTHFGEYADTAWHLAEVRRSVSEIETWIDSEMPGNPGDEQLLHDFTTWSRTHFSFDALDPLQSKAYKLANPPFISILGIQRYWKMFRKPIVGEPGR